MSSILQCAGTQDRPTPQTNHPHVSSQHTTAAMLQASTYPTYCALQPSCFESQPMYVDMTRVWDAGRLLELQPAATEGACMTHVL